MRIDEVVNVLEEDWIVGGIISFCVKPSLLTACPLCGGGGADLHAAFHRGGHRLDRCGRCGLLFLNPRDSEEGFEARYRDNIRSSSDYYALSSGVDGEVFGRRLNAMESLVPPGRLLDVGSNVGTFIEVARERGWSVVGIEPNPYAVAASRSRGLDVREGFFSPAWAGAWGEAPFNAVVMNDVLEHVPSPRSFLSAAFSLLAPGGVLVVNTPNFDSPLARLVQFKPEEHILYFTATSLSAAVVQAGGRVKTLTAVGRSRSFAALATGATLHPLLSRAAAWVHRLKLSPIANALLKIVFHDELFLLAVRA